MPSDNSKWIRPTERERKNLLHRRSESGGLLHLDRNLPYDLFAVCELSVDGSQHTHCLRARQVKKSLSIRFPKMRTAKIHGTGLTGCKIEQTPLSWFWNVEHTIWDKTEI